MQRLIPRISAEVVLQADPDAILTGSVDGVSDDQLDEWKKVRWADRGGKKQSVFSCLRRLFSRPTPRLLDAIQSVCGKLAIARENLARARDKLESAREKFVSQEGQRSGSESMDPLFAQPWRVGSGIHGAGAGAG